MAEKKSNPLDINGQHFDPNMYLDKLFKVSKKLHYCIFIFYVVEYSLFWYVIIFLGMYFTPSYGSWKWDRERHANITFWYADFGIWEL